MQTEIEIMLRNTNVVASVMPNDKLNTECPLFSVYVPTSTRGIWRLWCGEQREGNISKVQCCVRQATAFIQSTMQTQVVSSTFNGRIKAAIDIQQCRRVMESLKGAIVGLDNLKQTYRDDVSIVAKINMIQNEIVDFLHATTVLQTDTAPNPIRFDATFENQICNEDLPSENVS